MPRLLIIDDDETLLQMLADFLTHRGHAVTRCSDSLKAVELAEKDAPELAIIDYGMPRLTGTDVLAALRAKTTTQALPVIFLSGVDSLRYSSRVPPDNRVRFLHKPVKFEELEGAISELLDPEGWSSKA